jgi:hypothetical protein
MFLVLHTSGLTLIPLSIIGYRVAANSTEPSSIFIPCVLATLSATLASILIVGIKQKLKFDGVLLAWLGSLLAIIIGMLVLVQNLPLATKTQRKCNHAYTHRINRAGWCMEKTKCI